MARGFRCMIEDDGAGDHNVAATTATTAAVVAAVTTWRMCTLNLCIPVGLGRDGRDPQDMARNYLRGVRHIDEVLNKQTVLREHHNACATLNRRSSSKNQQQPTNGNNKNNNNNNNSNGGGTAHQYLASRIFLGISSDGKQYHHEASMVSTAVQVPSGYKDGVYT